MKQIKIVTKSVNNKALFKEISDTIVAAISDSGVSWNSSPHRTAFIEVIEDYLLDVTDEGKIEQSKVICDKRNNTTFSSLAKEYVLEVRYRQPGCLNVTSLCYHLLNKKR